MRIFKKGHIIPIEGGKIIEEFLGVQSEVDKFSVAHMIMPPGWTEPSHATKFDEMVIVAQGELTIIENKQEYIIKQGQVGWVTPTEDVEFCNNSQVECIYWAICVPAFSMDRVVFKE